MALDEILQRLCKFPIDKQNILTVYLDLRPDRSGKKLYQVYLKNRLAEISKHLPLRSAEQSNLNQEIKLIHKFLDEELNPAWKGLAVFSCSPMDLFIAIPMLRAPQNYLSFDYFPHLFPLLLQGPLYQTQAVIVGSSRQASLNIVHLGNLTKQLNLSWEDKHNTRYGRMGWSLSKFQRHLQEHLKQRSKEILENLEKLLLPEKIEYLFIIAEEGIAGELKKHMPASLKKKWIPLTQVDVHEPLPKILSATTEALLGIFRKEAEDLANYILNEAEPLGRAASGPELTLSALQNPQVERMVLDTQFSALGWRCQECFSLGFGGLPKACPYCEGSIAATNLREEIVLKGKVQGIEILFTEKFGRLLKAGGIGVLLKYKR